MDCPACKIPLHQIMSSQGAVIDFCDRCKGTWLDGGEVAYFALHPTEVLKRLKDRLINEDQSDRACPRCSVPMVRGGLLQPDLVVDHCLRCEGLWFDDRELALLARHSRGLSIKKEAASLVSGPAELEILGQDQEKTEKPPSRWDFLVPERQAVPPEPSQSPGPSRAAAAPIQLTALPSLALRSMGVLFFLYGLVFVVFVALIEVMKAPIALAFVFVILFAFLQFLFSPWIMDLTLNWFQGLRWVDAKSLPESLRGFMTQVAEKHQIPFPRVGIIEDGNPNAFTYGHTPRNARVVFTRGLMQMLSPEELNAVAGHELGHALHWDMLVMTAAMLVPTIFYLLYRMGMSVTRSGGRSSRSKGGGGLALVAIVALVCYYISQYVVLFLSRVREYYADRFAGEATRDPNALARGLVKIAYGLAGREDKSAGDKDQRTSRSAVLAGGDNAIQALGIFNPESARALAAVTLGAGAMKFSEENMLGAMQWDLWNPWAAWYELNSTHPLPAKRIQALGNQAAAYGLKPLVRFNLKQPESYWDEFFVDILVYLAPAALPVLFLLAGGAQVVLTNQPPSVGLLGGFLTFLGLGLLIKVLFSYRGADFPALKVSALIKKVKVSAVRPVPASLKGRIIGRGVPGLIWSADMVLQDETGFIFLDYRQPFGLIEWLFGLFRTPGIIGQEVMVKGWYRRSPMPYFEMLSMRVGGRTHNCYVYWIKLVLSIAPLALGILTLLYSLALP